MSMKRKNELTQQIEDNKPLDKKKVIPRFIAFAFFLVLGVVCVIIGMNSYDKRETGLQIIEAPADKDVPLYQVGVSFQHRFEGSSRDIKLGVNTLTELYSGALKDAFRLLDAETEYEGWSNLATLNQNRGREVVVPKALYEALRQAETMTRQGQVYNLFAGALYAEWESLRYQLEPAETDPATDPAEAERLERLASATSDLSNFSLEFLDDAACKLRFTVSQDYLDLLAELELSEVPILDFNVLKDAFKLQMTADRLEARGYDRGFLATESGLTLALSAYTDGGDYALFGPNEGQAALAAGCSVTPGSAAAQLRAFDVAEEPGYYALELEGETLLRHPWLPADGSYREVLYAALTVGKGKSLPETCYACLTLFAAETAAEAKAAAPALSGFDTALLLREAPQTVFVTTPELLPCRENGYETEPLS